MSDNISTLIGVLLDVSGSMQSNIGDGVDEEGGNWVRSIFRVIDDLVKHDVSSSNHVFAIGFGASRGSGIFDIIHTLEQCQEDESDQRSYEETIHRILQILENGGAKAVRKWALLSVIKPVVSHVTARRVLRELETNPEFVTKFVNEYLPSACKGLIDVSAKRVALTSIAATVALGPFALPFALMALPAAKLTAESGASTFYPATKDDIKKIVKKAKSYLMEKLTTEVTMEDVVVPTSIYSVHEASEILHGCVDEESLTKDRLEELMDTVEPLIYGGTPFYTSLHKALQLFRCQGYQDHKKLLFVVSDGMPTDDATHKDELFSQLSKAGVTTVGCFITKETQVEPRRLFSQASDTWERGAKLMFELSSKITTQLLPRTIFIKRGWKIDIANNETKLFLHVNHPDIMKDACNLARDVVCCQDALADVLVTVSLDTYINQCTDGFGAQEQVGGTCYANASAAVIHLSMKRILGRDEGYPDFDELRQDLIRRFGEHGANTLDVLQSVCPQYRLHCKKVAIQGALVAVTSKRPVVARFQLTDNEWDVFSKFYRNNPTGILTRKDLDITKRLPGVQTSGHAVVLTSYNSECLRLMNSWGTNWADMGFFRVQNADVIGLEFIDVYWTENDLSRGEKAYYAKHGAEVAKKLIDNLKGLQTTTYKCPLCNQTSKVTEYTGQMLQATCPKCHREFRSDGEGNILALNMYLTSLSR